MNKNPLNDKVLRSVEQATEMAARISRTHALDGAALDERQQQSLVRRLAGEISHEEYLERVLEAAGACRTPGGDERLPDASWNGYFYPESLANERAVMRNRLGIREESALSWVENALTAARAVDLFDVPLTGEMNFEYLKAIHRAIFRDLYVWAGTPRTVGMRKTVLVEGEFCTLSYIPPERIETAQFSVFEGISKKLALFRGAENPQQVGELLAFAFGELNHLHAFREGNGRTIKTYLNELARRMSWDVRWDQMNEPEHTEARSLASQVMKCEKLAAMIAAALVRIDAEPA